MDDTCRMELRRRLLSLNPNNILLHYRPGLCSISEAESMVILAPHFPSWDVWAPELWLLIFKNSPIFPRGKVPPDAVRIIFSDWIGEFHQSNIENRGMLWVHREDITPFLFFG